jgi:hypothetical protein
MSERSFVPNQEYDLELKIKGNDYTSDLVKCQIITSLSIPYIYVNLTLNIFQDDILIEEIYGQDKIELIVRLLDKDGNLKSDQTFDLMLLNSQYQRKTQGMANMGIETQREKTILNIPTVSRLDYKEMATIINKVYHNKIMSDILADLTKESKLELKLDSDNINKEVLKQVIIPPMTLYKSLNYLDKTFGIFDGPSGYFSFDGKLFVKNLSKRMTKKVNLNIYRLSTDEPDLENTIIDGKCSSSSENFYTYHELKFKYSNNTKFAIISKNLKYIVKPSDNLYFIIEKDLEDICKNEGLVTDNTKSFIEVESNSRIRYMTDHTGYEKTESFLKADISKAISNILSMSVTLEKDLIIENFFNVGDSVELYTKIQEEMDLGGKYILQSSVINFERLGNNNWGNKININCIRTSKTLK